MRVSVQRYLILLLCLLAVPAFAGFPPLQEGQIVHWSKTGSKNCTSQGGCDPSPKETLSQQAAEQLPSCQARYPEMDCSVQAYNDDKEVRFVEQGITYYVWRGGARVVATPREPCAQLTHEGGAPSGSECGSCAEGFIPTPDDYSGDGGTGFQCMRNREPGECSAEGKAEVITPQGAFCVSECAHGMFNGACLEDPKPDEPECSQDHPEYKGTVGYGGEAVLICGDPQNNCPTGFTWGLAQQGDTTVESCFPNQYNPPQCSGTDVLKIDEFGTACLPVKNPNGQETPGSEDDPNDGDSDGDGQGDLTGIAKQLQDVKKLLDRGNTNTDNINETLKGLGNKIQDGNKAITDAIGDIPGGGGGGGNNGGGEGLKDGEGNDYLADIKKNTRDTADRMQELQDGMEKPEGGFSLDDLKNGVPTLTETANSFKAAVLGTDIVQSVSGLTQIPSQSSCPVWTIPATDYWSAMPMNIHCDILEQYRGTFSVIFLFFWTGIAIFTFLRA